MESSNSNSQERELQYMQMEERQMHSNGMAWFKGLESHLRTLYLIIVFHVPNKRLFEIAFHTYFGEEHQTFKKKMFHNLDYLRLQFKRDNLHEVNAKTFLEVLRTQFKEFFGSKAVNSSDYLNQLSQEDFKDYTGYEPEAYRSNLLVHLDILEKFIDKRSKDVQINTVNALNANLVVMEDKCYGKEKSSSETAFSKSANESHMQTSGTESEKQDTSSRSRNDTDTLDAVIRHVYDKEAMAEVQLTVVHNVLANEQQHVEQPEIINEGKVDQDAKQCQEKVFATAALKNKLRNLRGISVDTKFAKPSILGKPSLQLLRNQSVVRQPNAFKSERPKFSKPRFASQVDVKNDLNSSKNMSRFSSSDMVHNYYLEETKKKTQEIDMNSRTSAMPSARLQNTTNGSKPKSKSTNQMTRNWPTSKSSCVTKTVVPKNPRSYLRWKLTGRIFKTVDLRWVPTRNLFASSTTKVDSGPPYGSNADITNPYECMQTLDVSAGTLNLKTCTSYNVKQDNLGVWLVKRLMSENQVRNYQEESFTHNEDMAPMTFSDSEFTAATYKRGLAIIEAQLITYRKNGVLFSEEVVVLKREVACKDYKINVLKRECEKVKQEKDGIEFKIEKFDKASKDLDQLLNKLDLSYSGLDEFKEPEFKGYGPKNNKQESNVVCDKESDNSKENSDESLAEEQVSQDKSSFVESSLNVDKETVFPVNKKVESTKPKNHEKPVKKLVRYAEMYRSQSPMWNQRNWNGQKSSHLGKDFVIHNKACYVCGSFDHLQYTCKQKRQLNGQREEKLV
ncbi:hypothetical protein Tco_0640339 [Tanacetum coccineum]